MCAWIKDWVNNGEAGDLRRHLAYYDVIVMKLENCRVASLTATYLRAITLYMVNIVQKSERGKVIAANMLSTYGQAWLLNLIPIIPMIDKLIS